MNNYNLATGVNKTLFYSLSEYTTVAPGDDEQSATVSDSNYVDPLKPEKATRDSNCSVLEETTKENIWRSISNVRIEDIPYKYNPENPTGLISTERLANRLFYGIPCEKERCWVKLLLANLGNVLNRYEDSIKVSMADDRNENAQACLLAYKSIVLPLKEKLDEIETVDAYPTLEVRKNIFRQCVQFYFLKLFLNVFLNFRFDVVREVGKEFNWFPFKKTNDKEELNGLNLMKGMLQGFRDEEVNCLIKHAVASDSTTTPQQLLENLENYGYDIELMEGLLEYQEEVGDGFEEIQIFNEIKELLREMVRNLDALEPASFVITQNKLVIILGEKIKGKEAERNKLYLRYQEIDRERSQMGYQRDALNEELFKSECDNLVKKCGKIVTDKGRLERALHAIFLRFPSNQIITQKNLNDEGIDIKIGEEIDVKSIREHHNQYGAPHYPLWYVL